LASGDQMAINSAEAYLVANTSSMLMRFLYL
jgi:hypothetical protein